MIIRKLFLVVICVECILLYFILRPDDEREYMKPICLTDTLGPPIKDELIWEVPPRRIVDSRKAWKDWVKSLDN